MTVSQVWAFCPPPCRNTTCGGSSPHFSALMPPDSMRATVGSGPVCADLVGVLRQQGELVETQQVVVGDLGHGLTLRTSEIQVRSERRCVSVEYMAPTAYAPKGLTIRTAEDADWPAMALVAATCFGAWRPEEANDAWRTMMPAGSAVVACDGQDVVGMAFVSRPETHRAWRRRAADGRRCPGWRSRRHIGDAAR